MQPTHGNPATVHIARSGSGLAHGQKSRQSERELPIRQGQLALLSSQKKNPIENLGNSNMEKAFLNKIRSVEKMIERGQYKGALAKLENEVLNDIQTCRFEKHGFFKF